MQVALSSTKFKYWLHSPSRGSAFPRRWQNTGAGVFLPPSDAGKGDKNVPSPKGAWVLRASVVKNFWNKNFSAKQKIISRCP